MASGNPYNTNNFPGKFVISYEGNQDDFHCFRVHLRGHKGMDALMFKTEVNSWLMNCADGDQFSGHGFGDSKLHPNVSLENKDGKDFFVLMNRMIDIVRFEERFRVTGFSPAMVA